jgi:zinc protease
MIATLIARSLFVVLFLSAPGPLSADEPHRLDNGMLVFLRPIPGVEQVAVVQLYNLGVEHDPVNKSGLTHLLEHVYCTAAAGDIPARDFMEIQKKYGIGYNQQTGPDFTVLAGVVGAKQLDAELKEVGARMTALTITDADLARELPRVLQELSNMYGGMPSLAAINRLRNVLRPIPQGGQHGGNPEQLKTITLADLKEFWQAYYKPNNSILVLAGNFEPGKTLTLISNYFGGIKPGQMPPARIARLTTRAGSTNSIGVKPIVPNATGVAAIGYTAPLPGTKDYAPFLVAVSRLQSQTMSASPGPVQPLFYPMLDDPTMLALAAPLPAPDGTPKSTNATTNAEAVLKLLSDRLQVALKPTLNSTDKMLALNAFAMLGTADMPDSMWAQNLYGLAFSIGRRHQLGIDAQSLRSAIQNLTGADLQRVATNVFAPDKRASLIIKVEE